MVRTTLFAMVVALSFAGCADDPVVAGGGLPTNIKPNNMQAPSAQTNVIGQYVEPADPDTGCLECTILHVPTDGGENLKFVDPNGLEVCSLYVGSSGMIWNDTCAELQITPHVTLK